MKRLLVVLLAGLLAAAAFLMPAVAADEPVFLRLRQGDDGKPLALEVAVARFRRDGVRVDLVGAVHLADRAYFETVDRKLASYEVVLYELVGDPEALAAPPPDVGLSALGWLQGSMTDLLGLSYQLDHIDYRRGNMVHADLTREAFSASMRERGESLLQLLFRAWTVSMTPDGQAAALRQQAELVEVLFAADRRLALKRMLAGELADEALLREVLSGPEGSTLIEVRNARAIAVLAEQLDQGARRIAIFYGAGHLADLAERLTAGLGFELEGMGWLTAWDLRGG